MWNVEEHLPVKQKVQWYPKALKTKISFGMFLAMPQTQTSFATIMLLESPTFFFGKLS